jgi:hypothetical protein
VKLQNEGYINFFFSADYLERAVEVLKESGQQIDDSLLINLSPLSWEHINLIGDYYIWHQNKYVEQGKFRPLWGA